MKYTRLMRARIEGRESDVPVTLMHKGGLRNFCEILRIPTPREYAKFESPEGIDLSSLPDEFVLKPAYASTSDGVMVLERTGELYEDAMSKTTYSSQDIVDIQRRVFDKYSKTKLRQTIAEQRVVCSEGLSIPADYKFLAFQGEIGIIIRIDRSESRLRMSYFDGDFVPVVDKRVRFNDNIADREYTLPPANWREMLDLATRVSYAVPTPCARIDLYSDKNDGPMLGEITLTPGSFYYDAGHTLSLSENHRLGAMWIDAAKRMRLPLAVQED